MDFSWLNNVLTQVQVMHKIKYTSKSKLLIKSKQQSFYGDVSVVIILVLQEISTPTCQNCIQKFPKIFNFIYLRFDYLIWYVGSP